MANWEKICALAEVPPGTRKMFPAVLWNILIFNTGKRIFACANECPHLGEPLLTTGELHGHVVRCSAHGYEMDLSSGKCMTEAGVDLPIFQVEVRDGWIWIKL